MKLDQLATHTTREAEVISIIIPFYNTERYLEQCLLSIKEQTFSNYECLMINDGSTDNSLNIAKKFADEDGRFKLIDSIHIGFPKAKNLGLDLATGDYICFVDSDDFINKDYLKILFEAINETGTDICCCGYQSFCGALKQKIVQHEVKIYDNDKMSKIFNYPVATFMWNKLFKRELFDNLRFDDVIALSDTILCPIIFDRAAQIASITDILYYYRKHQESMSFKVKQKGDIYWEHRLNIYLNIYNFLMKKYPKYRLYYINKLEEELVYIYNSPSKEILFKYYKQIESIDKKLLKFIV